MSSPTDPDFDPMCDPNNPRKVTYEDIQEAAKANEDGVIKKTPLVAAHFSQAVEMDLFIKCEFLQYTGSFKDRGARYAMQRLTPQAKARGVIAASLGNHSQGISYSGKCLGVTATVVMPTVAPLIKVEKCKGFGANVILYGSTLKEAKLHALEISRRDNITFINGYDHPDVIAAHGVVGLEILEQMPCVDAILVPVGGGGLLSGVAIAVKHLKPDCLIYGVETDLCASMTESLKAGHVVKYEIGRTLADGLAVSVVGCNAFYNAQPLVDKMVVVTEDCTARAILKIVEMEKYVVEGGGAVAVAAIISGLVPELKGKKVVCISSGGNIDTSILSICLDRGLVAERRMVKFKVNIPDNAMGLSELTGLIASIGVQVKEIHHERAWLQGNIFSVRVKVICETRGPAHVEELHNLIASHYKECFFMKKTDGTKSTRHISLTDSLEHVLGKQ